MGLTDLIKGRKERERDENRSRRRGFRDAQTALEVVKTRVKKLQSERDEIHSRAREYVQGGQKVAAQRLLQSVRRNELQIHNLEQKKWVFEQVLTKLELAHSDREITRALKTLNIAVKIDPEEIEDTLSLTDEQLSDQEASDRSFERVYEKEMAGVAGSLHESVPSVEEMMADLEDEIVSVPAGSIRTSAPTPSDPGSSSADLLARARKVIES